MSEKRPGIRVSIPSRFSHWYENFQRSKVTAGIECDADAIAKM